MNAAVWLLAGAALLGGASACALRAAWLPRAIVAQAAGAALLAVAGAIALIDGEALGSPFTGGLEPRVGVDGLSGVFLATLGLVAAPSLLHGRVAGRTGWRDRAVACLTGLFVLVLALVLCARDVVTFLAGWELMTLVPAAIVLVVRSDEVARRTVFAYVAITHLGGVGVWVALLALADAGAIGDPSPPAAAPLVLLAALVGFGTKAGLMPFHAWLPRTHPIAPAHVSALMSGVLVKVALYGLVRVVFEWSAPPDSWFGALVLGLGALSAVGGAVYAAFAGELKRLLAWSTVENVGVIALGLGAALLLRAAGDTTWASFALAAALLHVVAHALFKGLLFLGAGSLAQAVGGLELDRLGGLLGRLPRTGWAFVVGAVALAGVPPLSGFASEWATLQGLLHAVEPGRTAEGLAAVAGLGALAMTAGLALLGVVRLLGLVLLGPPRGERAAEAREVGAAGWVGTAFLAACCVLLGVLPGLVFARLVALAPGAPTLTPAPGLDLPQTGSLPTLAVALALAAVAAALAAAARGRAAEPTPTWACGQPLDHGLLWTSAGFTKPLRLVGEAVLRPEREVVVRSAGGVVQGVSYRGRVPHHLESALYAPVRRGALALARQARRIQSGRIGTYLAYLIVLVVALLAAARFELLG